MSRTYDPTQVAVVLGISALVNWNSVRAVRDESEWMFSAGTQGEVTRTKNANKLGTITIVTPQSSLDNETLSTYALSGSTIPCVIRDNNGTSLYVMPLATVSKWADSENAKESGTREWEIKGRFDIFYVGSNNLDVAAEIG